MKNTVYKHKIIEMEQNTCSMIPEKPLFMGVSRDLN